MIRDYVWMNGAPVAQIDSGEAFSYLHVDHLNTPRLATDDSQTVVWRWDSDAFGTTLADEDPDGNASATTVNLRFPGQYFDAETGFHYNYYRTYDPTIGRYVESDPIGLDGDVNTFGYVGANPLGFKDTLGLESAGILPDQDVRDLQAGRISLEEYMDRIEARALGGAIGAVCVIEVGVAVAFGPEVATVFGIVASGGDPAAFAGAGGRLANGADNVANAPRLSKQLKLQSARSPFAENGELTADAIKNSREIIPASRINNPAVPSGYSKYSTQSFQSPSGNFQVHYYRNSKTGDVSYSNDYKVVYN